MVLCLLLNMYFSSVYLLFFKCDTNFGGFFWLVFFPKVGGVLLSLIPDKPREAWELYCRSTLKFLATLNWYCKLEPWLVIVVNKLRQTKGAGKTSWKRLFKSVVFKAFEWCSEEQVCLWGVGFFCIFRTEPQIPLISVPGVHCRDTG